MNYEIPIDKLYCFIYLNDKSHIAALENGNFKIVPLRESPIVKFLQGYEEAYLHQSDLFIKRPQSIPYNLGMYELGKFDYNILAIKFEDKFVLCDGMHRSSILYHKGFDKISITLATIEEYPQFANFAPYIKSEKFFNTL